MANYTVDAQHTSAEFTIRHLMISKVRGRFSDIAGTIVADETTGIPSEVDVTIAVESIDTREAQRDTHLKSPDFLDAAQFPTMTFKSSKIEPGSDGAFKMTGALTIHGITKDVTFDTTFEGAGTDPWGGSRLGYEAHAKINRSDFALNFNAPLEAGGVMIGDEVKLELNVEAVLAKVPA